MSVSPFYPFSNLAIAIKAFSDDITYDNFGNPVLSSSESFYSLLVHVEEETEEDREIPRGLRDTFNYGVDAFLMVGHVTDNNGSIQLSSNILYFYDYPAIYKPQFFGGNQLQKGIVQIHKKLQPAFNENYITGDNIQLTFTPKDTNNESELLYSELETKLDSLYA